MDWPDYLETKKELQEDLTDEEKELWDFSHRQAKRKEIERRYSKIVWKVCAFGIVVFLVGSLWNFENNVYNLILVMVGAFLTFAGPMFRDSMVRHNVKSEFGQLDFERVNNLHERLEHLEVKTERMWKALQPEEDEMDDFVED